LREECRLRFFENKVLRRIFGHRRDETKKDGEDYIIRSFMICTFNQILFGISNQENLRWVEYVARIEKGRRAYRVLVGELEGRKPLDRPRHILEDNIKMDLEEVEWMARTRLIELRVGIGSGL
jgi:hypothetical protein